MKSLKIFTIWIACVSVVFTSTYSQAALDVKVRWTVDYLNHKSNLKSMVRSYKKQFKTKADHRALDKFFKQNHKTAEKWLWRFEPKSNDQLALRINGRVQAILSEINIKERSFKVNGTPIVWLQGQSFENYYQGIVAALNKKTAQHPLESLFFEEAHAAFLLAIGALLAGGLLVATAKRSHAKAKATQCQYSPYPVIARSSRGDRTVVANDLNPMNFRHGKICKSKKMIRNFTKRMDIVRKNFKSNEKFNSTVNNSFIHDEACVTQYKTQHGNAKAVQICKCIYRKKLPCEVGGWNMTEAMATSTCFTGFSSCQVVDTPYPQEPAYPGYTDDPLDVPTYICANKTENRKKYLCETQGVCCSYDYPDQSYDDPLEDTNPVICANKTADQRVAICQSRGLCCYDGNYDQPTAR